MKASAFEYHAARSLSGATELLARYSREDARILAGGQSLVPAMALRVASPAHLIDINGVDELKPLTAGDGYLTVRACVRHAAFEQAVEPGPLGALLARVVRYIAHYPIRTRGTMCGSLAHADPASEWCLVAAALDAELIALSRRGKRTLPAREWFQGLMTTALQPDELLLEVRFKALPGDTRFGFQEYSRRAGDFALAMALVTFRVQTGVIAEPRMGIGAVEATPRRIAQAEDALRGRKPTRDVYEEAAKAAAAAINPLTDPRYDAAYRRDLTRTMVRRALEEAWPSSS
jgi:aerobic carbon-monoxide dehydrogenase medium subunit